MIHLIKLGMEKNCRLIYKNETVKKKYAIITYSMIKVLYETDYFGEVAISENRKWTASIIANEHTELATISKEDFLQVLESVN